MFCVKNYLYYFSSISITMITNTYCFGFIFFTKFINFVPLLNKRARCYAARPNILTSDMSLDADRSLCRTSFASSF